MDTDSFVLNVGTEDFYKDISEDVKDRFDTSNFNCDRPLRIGVNKKVVGFMKDELGGGIITEFVALRPKAYSYITDDLVELKKAKRTKKSVVKKFLDLMIIRNVCSKKKRFLKRNKDLRARIILCILNA